MLIAKSRPIGGNYVFGIVIVSVTRIAAYVSSKLAEDMAKLLPWALIIIFDRSTINYYGKCSDFL